MSSKLIPGWGGVRFSQMSDTACSGLKSIGDPLYIKLPLCGDGGETMQPVAAVGDHVPRGGLIATPVGEYGIPIYSGIAGTVTEIVSEKRPDGTEQVFVTIRSNGSDRTAEAKPYCGMLAEAESSALIALARRAAITERDGFPLWKKMEQSTDAELVLINAVACEPEERVFPEMISAYPERLLCGIKILLKAVGKRHAIIVLSEFMKEQARLLREKIKENGDDALFSIEFAADRYPMYEDKQLVSSIDCEQPSVFDALACIELFAAFSEGHPITDAVVTVCGDAIRNPQTLIVPVGTEISVLAAHCGGFRERPVRILCGGQMRGKVCRENDHIGRNTRLIRFDGSIEKHSEKDCIRCGRCVSACPSRIAPLYLSKYSRKKNIAKCKKLRIDACIDCGCCSYVCPSKIPLAQNIRAGKLMISEQTQSSFDGKSRKAMKGG